MKLHASLVAAVCSVFLGHGGALASDLPRSDPDRAAILQAVRLVLGTNFVVKDLRKFGDFAFVCTLETPDGAIIGADYELDVYHWTFVRHAGTWHAFPAGRTVTRDARHVSCAAHVRGGRPSPHQIASRQDVTDLTVDAVKEQIRSDLDDGHLIDADAPALRTLDSQHLLGEIPIEHEKAPFSPDELDVAKGRCATNRRCLGGLEKAFDFLAKARTDEAVSSLVWENCKYGLKLHALALVESCVSFASRLPYCGPRMTLNADREEIGRCVTDIRARCEKEIPGWCD